MNERWLLALALIAVCAFGLWLLRKQSPFALPVVALGTTALMGTFFPLMSLYVEPRSWRNLGSISEESMHAAQVEYLCFGLGFTAAVGCAWAFKRGLLGAPREVPPPPAYIRFRDGLMAWGLVGLGGALYSAYVAQVGVDTLVGNEDFANKYLESRGMGTLLFGLKLMIAGVLWGEASDLPGWSRRGLRLIALGIFSWAFFFIAVRTYAVAIAVGYFAAFCTRRKVQVRRIRLRVIALLLIAYFGAESYAILRSTWMSSGDLMQAVELARGMDTDESLGGVVGGSEFSHPFITTAEVLQYEEGGTLMGSSYVDAVLAFVPTFLVAERPSTLAQDFVAEYYPALDARGGGASFSLVAEAWWNFGALFGSFLIGLAAGGLLLWCQVRARRAPHGLVQRLLPYLAFACVLLHRGQVQATFKQIASLVLPVIALAIVARVAWGVLRGPRPAPRRVPENINLGVR